MTSLTNFFDQKMPLPENMLRDDLLDGITWADLEVAWKEIASPANQHLIHDFMTALWKESAFYPEPFNLVRILTATALLAGVDSLPGFEEESPSKS